MYEEIDSQLTGAHRVVIVGGPLTGKTTLARRLGSSRVRSTDELRHLDWSEVSAAAALWLDEAGGWVIEGVAMARAIRKWLRAHPSAPIDFVIVLASQPRGERTKGQASMAKGVATVWDEIVTEVLARGARVLKYDGQPQEQLRGEGEAAPPPAA
jgi:hypothetical protein